MNENTITGYHATATLNIPSIMQNGFTASEPNQGHWLGKGIYLYTNLYYAIEWEMLKILNKTTCTYDEIQEKCDILSVELDTTNYNVIDFSDPQGYIIFEQLLQKIKALYPKEEYEKILNKGFAYIIKILENLEKITQKKFLSKYDIVCAVYPKYIIKPKTHLAGDFIPCVQKQICIKNANSIKNITILEHNDLRKNLFKLIQYNRGEKND